MSHAQGNDLADERRNAKNSAANPPTLPPNTGDTDWLDEALVEFGQILQRNSPEAADTIRSAYRQAKAAIEQKLNEARQGLLADILSLPCLQDKAVNRPSPDFLIGQTDAEILNDFRSEVRQALQATKEKLG